MNAEAYIFGALDYDLNWPSPLSFMRRINSADGFEISYRIMTKYLMEAALYDPRFVGAKPSLLAAAAYYLSLKVCNSMPWVGTIQMLLIGVYSDELNTSKSD